MNKIFNYNFISSDVIKLLKNTIIGFFTILFLIILFFLFDDTLIINKVYPTPLNSFELLAINPISNIFIFIVLICMVISVSFLFSFAGNSYFFVEKQLSLLKDKIHIRIIPIVLVTIIFSIWKPTYHSGGNLDTFHEGDFLAPAINQEYGLKPYKDYYFSQGYFQNVLISDLVFKYFGKSISNRKKVESFISIINYLILLVLVYTFVKYNIYYCYVIFVSFCLLSYTFTLTINRDIFYFCSIIFSILLLNNNNFKSRFIYIFLSSFFSIASIYYSLDRGFFSIVILLAFLVIFCIINNTISYLVVGILSLLISLFIWFYYTEISILDIFQYFKFVSKYYSSIYGLPIDLDCREWKLFVVVFAINTFVIFLNFFQSIFHKKNSFKNYLSENISILYLYIISIVSAPSALTRADGEHIAYSISIGVILFLFLLIMMVSKNLFISIILRYISFAGLILIFVGKGWLIVEGKLWTEKFPNKVDEAYLSKDYIEATSFLKNEYKKGLSFYPINSELIWFYLVNQPCYCKFQMAIFYQPIQNDLIQCLEKNNVEYIIMESSDGYKLLDGIEFKFRLNKVYNFINNNYLFYNKIGSVIIYKKKNG